MAERAGVAALDIRGGNAGSWNEHSGETGTMAGSMGKARRDDGG